jgi:hypothetical protein
VPVDLVLVIEMTGTHGYPEAPWRGSHFTGGVKMAKSYGAATTSPATAGHRSGTAGSLVASFGGLRSHLPELNLPGLNLPGLNLPGPTDGRRATLPGALDPEPVGKSDERRPQLPNARTPVPDTGPTQPRPGDRPHGWPMPGFGLSGQR